MLDCKMPRLDPSEWIEPTGKDVVHPAEHARLFKIDQILGLLDHEYD